MCANKKISILSLIVIFASVLFYTPSVFASASITLTGGAWDVGLKGGAKETDSIGNAWTVTNNSSGSEDLNVKVASSGSWDIGGGIGTNSSMIYFVPSRGSAVLQTNVNYGAQGLSLTETDTKVFTLAANETQSFGLRFYTPTIGSEAGAHTLTVTLTAANWRAWACGDSVVVTHTAANGVAPADKVVNYATAASTLSGSNKCWIIQNLGASYPPSWWGSGYYYDYEVYKGWYWQFNRKQGYAISNNAVRTPATEWVTDPGESDWLLANDPCALELGSGWRLPTRTEWSNVVTAGGWRGYGDAWSSALKLNAALYLTQQAGAYPYGDYEGYYWSSTHDVMNSGLGWMINTKSASVSVGNMAYNYGLSVRCIKD